VPALWLFPLVLIGIIALVTYVRMGIRWSWGFCLQWLVILLVAAYGIFDSQSPEISKLCVWLGWGLFAVVYLIPRFYLQKMGQDFMALRGDDAIKRATTLKWFFWGQPGKLWVDMAIAMSLFMKTDSQSHEKAEALLKSWYNSPVPKQTREAITSYILTGLILAKDWKKLIDDYQEIKAASTKPVSWTVASSAMRAYLELNMINEAAQAICQADVSNAQMQPGTIDLTLISFFSLAGAKDELVALFDRLNKIKQPLPLVAKDYWLGRCLVVRGETEEAKQVLEEAASKLPPSMATWKLRIETQLKNLGETTSAPACDYTQWSDSVKQVQSVLIKSQLISDIFWPTRIPKAVVGLVVLNLIVFALSHLFMVSKSPAAVNLSMSFFNWGTLYGPYVLEGQWWRLVTYQFLHSYFAHIGFNLVGLWWFGKMAANLFGSVNFVVIYLLAGTLGGIAQIALAPDIPAIGASGAVLGLFGAIAAGIFRLKGTLPINLRSKELLVMTAIALTQVLFDHFMPHVAAYVHLGGLVAGFLIGIVLPMRNLGQAKTSD
jgi:rhomboid protease GluP